MPSPPANSSPTKPSPAKPSPVQKPPMTWSAVVKKPPPSKKSAPPLIPPIVDNRVPTNARACLPPGSTSDAQAHPFFSSSTGGHRGSILGEARESHLSASCADSQPALRGALVQAGRGNRGGQSSATPARSPYAGIYPTSGNNTNYYHPLQARADVQPVAKVTKSFASEATYRNNFERVVNVERSNSTMPTSLAFINTRLAAVPQTHKLEG
ncbi:hypothetical protein PMIN06_008803 [Paraphaeosphaeria minitans]